MKVKIIKPDYSGNLEANIQEFIDSRPMDIIDIKIQANICSNNNQLYLALIMYKEL